MTNKDRNEIKDMIHDILSGWHSETVAREEVTNMNLDSIKEHLKKINGKVSEHEKIINVNLPHNIALCPQRKIIMDLDMWRNSSMEVEKSNNKSWMRAIELIGVIIALATIIVTYVLISKQNSILRQQIYDLGTPVIVNSRGEIKNLPAGDSIKYFRDSEFKEFEK